MTLILNHNLFFLNLGPYIKEKVFILNYAIKLIILCVTWRKNNGHYSSL